MLSRPFPWREAVLWVAAGASFIGFGLVSAAVAGVLG